MTTISFTGTLGADWFRDGIDYAGIFVAPHTSLVGLPFVASFEGTPGGWLTAASIMINSHSFSFMPGAWHTEWLQSIIQVDGLPNNTLSVSNPPPGLPTGTMGAFNIELPGGVPCCTSFDASAIFLGNVDFTNFLTLDNSPFIVPAPTSITLGGAPAPASVAVVGDFSSLFTCALLVGLLLCKWACGWRPLRLKSQN